MMVASSMGATAFQKGLGAMHSLSHPCSANLNTHHGLTNAVVMPYVLAWNRAALEDKMVRLAAFLGLPQHSFDGVLRVDPGLAADHRRAGHAGRSGRARTSTWQTFSQQAFDDPSTGGNPLPMDVPKISPACIGIASTDRCDRRRSARERS